MNRTPITRRTPLAPGNGFKRPDPALYVQPKPRSPLPRRSARRVREERRYAVLRDEYMEAHPFCERCPNASTECHHRAKRAGEMLCDDRFFIALCWTCHNWVHFIDPVRAAEEGWVISGHLPMEGKLERLGEIKGL